MKQPIGKLVNCDTQAELKFSLTPVDFHIEEVFDLRVEPCLGLALPIVSFHGGGGRTLTAQLIFDRDADDALDMATVQTFVSSLAKVDDNTKSIPQLQFKMGAFSFKGYVNRLGVTHARFSPNGQATQVKLQLSILAVEDGSNGNS